MKFKIFKFKSVTSTNDVALNLIQEEKETTGCVYAELQTKGRGTHGRRWISDKGNLFGTIFFQLKNNYPSFSEFTIINPIIISKVVSNFCSNKKITFKSAVLYKKEKSKFRSDYIIHNLKDNPWIVFPYELRELISIDQLKKELKKKG